MADLRTALYTGNGNLSADQLARIDAADMGTLRRSYTGGRITNDINPMLADIASLEADGTPEARTKAAGLRDQVSALEQRRAAYAPEVGKVENINGIGSGLTWAGEQVGQGVASMQDMMLTGAGLTAAGRAVGAIPHPIARAAGMALQGGGVLAPYLMNQRQLAGEAYGDMTEDPALMARTTPQQRYEMARNYGALAAIPDTALPALVGRQLAGAGLRKGLSKIGPAAMTGLELLGEGTTELGQEVGKQYALGQLNPERDTSQDASANLNSFLGGAVGAGPFAAAGAYADAGYRRVGDTAEKIGTKAGQVVDLAGQKLGPMAEEVAKKGRGWIGAGKEKVDASLDSFRGDDGRIDLSKVVAAGKETAGEVRDNAARAVFGITPQERSILEGGTAESIPADIAMDPDPQKAVAWVAQNDRDRVGLVTDRLSSIDDPQAIDIFDRIVAAGDAQDPGAQRLAVDEGAKYLLDRAEEIKFANRAERIAQTAGSTGAAVGKAVGKGILNIGKAVVDGVKEGLSKKNAQVEPWEQRKADMQAARRSAPAERLAQLWSEALAAAAPQSTIGEKGTALFRSLGERIADLTEVSPPLNQINRIAQDIRVGFGKNAEQILDNLASMGDKKSAPTIEAIRAAVVAGRTPAGQRQIAQARQAVSGQLLTLLPVEQAKAIIANGQQMDLLEHIEDFADGHAAPALRPALEAAVGKDALAKMVDLVNGVTTSKDRGNEALLEARDDDVTDYELRQAEKKSVKGSGPKIYGVSKSPVLRDNPFAPNERMSKEEFQRWMDDEIQRKSEGLPPQIEPEFERPMLFKTGDPQLDARIAHMDEKLDSTYHIAPRSAWEVMDDTDMPLARRLATYRDYMREDGQDTRTIQKALLDAMDGHDFGEWANPAGGTSAEQQRGSGIKTTTPAAQTKSEARLTTGQRNVLFNEMQAYFSERHLAVAEQIADREPSRIGRTELLSMVRAGKRAFDLHRMKDNPDEHLDQSNLLMFKSEMANQKTGAPGVIYIPVHQLVKWVQAQRERSETVEAKQDDEKDTTYSNRNKNKAYLADVMEGISIILNSGMVEDQLPSRVEGLSQDKKPKLAPFTEQNIPKNLRLATMTYGQMMFRLEKKNANITRAEVPAGPPAPVVEGDERRDARADSRYQDKVFKEQNFVEEDDDRKPIDEAPESEHLARKQWHQALTPAEQTELRRRVLTDSDDRLSPEELGFDVRTDEGLADYAEFKKDLLLTGTRGAMFNPDANGRRLSGAKTTDSVETTPLDFFSDIKKPAVPDEFDDQQFRTKNGGGESVYSPLPAESKMNAWKEADKNADALLNKFRTGDVAGGLAEIEQRLRAAKTPSYSPDKYAAVGGLHYAIPLAQVLNPDVISTMDIVDADAQRIVAARAELAGLVRDAKGFSDAQRVRLTRAMAPAESAARITLANYRKALEKAINAAPTEEQMTEAPKAAAPKAEAPKAAASKDALATAITLRQNYLDNPPADYSADTVRGIIKWAERQAERVAAAAKELDGSEDFKRVDEVNDRAIDLRVLIKSAKESLTRDEAAQAVREVAAQSPKSSSAPGGGRSAEGSAGTGRDIGALPMYYRMPPEGLRADLRGKYPAGTTTAQLMADGLRTATTRRVFGEVGDVFTVGGTKYRITGVAPIDLRTAKGRAAWAQKEGWDPEYAMRAYPAQVRDGAIQTTFERVVAPGGGRDVTVVEHQSIGYRERTKHNADSAGLTVAIAADYSTAGEKLTKNVAGEKYLAIPIDVAPDKAGVRLAKAMRQLDTTTLNVAGNGIYTLAAAGHTQASVNEHVFGLIKTAHKLRPITKIVTGGQTGVDIAGAVAARALGIPATVTMPRGFLQRNEAGQDQRHSAADIERQIEDGAKALSPAPGGGKLESRVEGAASWATGIPVEALELAQDIGIVAPAKAATAWRRGETKQQFMAGATGVSILAQTLALRLQGHEATADKLWGRFTGIVDQTYALPYDRDLEDALNSRLVASPRGAALSSFLQEYAVSDLPAGPKVIARAVSKIAGAEVVKLGNIKADGEFHTVNGGITVSRMKTLGTAATVLHEGVHAATAAAIVANPELSRALYRLLAHVTSHNPQLAQVYGTTNTLEFLAEGLSNMSFQRELYKIPANETVAKYLGRTVANAWEAFVTIVRKALNIPAIHDSALTQLISLGGQAMKETAALGTTSTREAFSAYAVRGMVPLKQFEQLVAETAAHPKLSAAGSAHFAKFMMRDLHVNDGKVPHSEVLSTTIAKKLLDYTAAAPGSLGAEFIDRILVPAVRTATLRTPPAALPNAQAPFANGNPWEGGLHDKWSDEDVNFQFYTESEGLVEWMRREGRDKEADQLERLAAKALQMWRDSNSGELRESGDGDTTFIREVAQRYGMRHTLAELNKAPGRPNAQDRTGSTRVASDADIAEAKAYFHKVLGPKVKVLFKEITGYSGEWLDAENTAVISTMAAAGTMQTAYHEALHAFFSKYVKGDPKVLPIMKALAENERVLERVKALLHEYPAALAQLADGEERLAYIYQFWAAGLLKLGPGPGRTWLQKLGKFFRGVLGLVSDSERAVDLLEAFHAGKMAEPSAAGRVIAKLTAQPVTVKVRRKLDGLSQLVAAATLPAESILLNSPSAAVRALGRKFFSNPGDEEAGKYPEAYLNARKRESIKYHGVFARAVAGLDSSDLKEVAKYLQQGTDPANIPYKPHADAVKGVREALDRFYAYMKDEKGLSVGYIERYYPVIWSTDILHDKKDEFIKMLTDNYGDILAKGVASSKGNLDEAGVAERIWAALIRNGGGDNKIAPARSDGVLVPYFESGEHRVLNWIKPEHREPFLQKDLIGQISKYFHEGARKAEYQSRFGEHGEKLSELLDPQKKAFDELRWADANKDGPPPGLLDVEYVTKPGQKTLIIATFAGTAETELMAEADKMVARGELKNATAAKKWVARQMRDVRQAVGALEGTLGKDIPEGWRKFNSWMTVYQNVRLLPLALFSSIVDPLGMVARGAELKDAYAAFLAGMKEVVRAWGNEFRDEPKASGLDPKWTRLAEAVGATEAELFAHHVSEEFSSDYMVRGAKTINDKMFILNGMEAWNRAMRIAATKAAVEFIMKHKGLPDKIHSARWLQELGLKPEDIVLNADGELVTDRHELARLKNIPLEQATKEMQRTHWAINRWVEGAILTPNAAQRPSWSSDPRWGIFFHLKQFTYSFHYTLMKRAVKELEYGNLAPIGAFAWYIPVMLASDITRGLIQGGGELPAYMKGWDVGDHLINATQRAGFLSVGQIGVDAVADPASLGGPAIEQMIDAMRDPLEHSTIKALPLQPIFRNAALN